MAEKLIGFLMKKIFVKGWYGEFTVKVEDGVPTRIMPTQNIAMKEIR